MKWCLRATPISLAFPRMSGGKAHMATPVRVTTTDDHGRPIAIGSPSAQQ
jgi:hypothetical protein